MELYNYRVKAITKIVDGDTFDCIIDLGFEVLLESRIRMAGIDAPESRTRDLEEKKFGLYAKEWLTNNLTSDNIIIQTEYNDEKGKFGRILGSVFVDGININETMIAENIAVKYQGQSKDSIALDHLKNRQLLLEQGKVN